MVDYLLKFCRLFSLTSKMPQKARIKVPSLNHSGMCRCIYAVYLAQIFRLYERSKVVREILDDVFYFHHCIDHHAGFRERVFLGGLTFLLYFFLRCNGYYMIYCNTSLNLFCNIGPLSSVATTLPAGSISTF